MSYSQYLATYAFILFICILGGCSPDTSKDTDVEDEGLIICEGETGPYDNSMEDDYGSYSYDETRPRNPWWAKVEKTLWRDEVQTGELFTFGFLPANDGVKYCGAFGLEWDPEKKRAIVIYRADDYPYSTRYTGLVLRLIYLSEDGSYKEQRVYRDDLGVTEEEFMQVDYPIYIGETKIFERNLLVPMTQQVHEYDRAYYGILKINLDTDTVEGYYYDVVEDDSEALYFYVTFTASGSMLITATTNIYRVATDGTRELVEICVGGAFETCSAGRPAGIVGSVNLFGDDVGLLEIGESLYRAEYNEQQNRIFVTLLNGRQSMFSCPSGQGYTGCPFDGMSFDYQAKHNAIQFYMTDVGVMYYEFQEEILLLIDQDRRVFHTVAGHDNSSGWRSYSEHEFGGDGNPVNPAYLGCAQFDAITDDGDYLYVETNECVIRGIAGPLEEVYRMYH